MGLIQAFMEHYRSHQTAWANASRGLIAISIPGPQEDVIPGVQWGCATEVFTPAFWKYQSAAFRAQNVNISHCIGKTIIEEVAVCLLGGYGMPAELGLAAFCRLRDRDLLKQATTVDVLEEALHEPFPFDQGQRRYRFPRQKANYLWHAMQTLSCTALPSSSRPLRDFLTSLPGIGPKTASWVVRNHLRSDEVAIIDVHVLRAGTAIGLFPPDVNPSKEYFRLEEIFLRFCDALGEPASLIDALMWDYMRRIGKASAQTRNT
ncbi:hypothetical protein [Bradyrhizobium sp. Tv2a-2]|uniref:8-oxoguanine DNA glycosylase n=1 Tax=Bradyrhizobium sp. Tv2a-2 TaxID=113395 RepID=UPI0004640CBE|nr:hypothetical protein [Bradyrhizobium sp. Tv2a-2]